MQWWVYVSMETQTAISCRHVASPDHPDAGCRFLPLVRGPVTIQGVRDPWGVLDPAGVRSPWEVRSPGCSRTSPCLFRDTWCLRTFPNRGTGPDHSWGNRTSDRRGPAVWM